jgi:hypothetical protein
MFVFLVCCAGSSLYNELNSRSEESYSARARVCVSNYVRPRNKKCGDLGLIWAVASQKEIKLAFSRLVLIN